MPQRADASAWASAYAYQHEQERREERRLMYVRRRRWLLWTPLAVCGVVLLAWQLTSAWPIPLVVYVAAAMCLPLAVDA
jgi:bacteriorhodopsin